MLNIRVALVEGTIYVKQTRDYYKFVSYDANAQTLVKTKVQRVWN
jgi:hypothetical protein